MGTGSAGLGFGFWLTGKLGRAWVVHGIGAWVGARCWLVGRGRGLFSVGYTIQMVNYRIQATI